MFAFRGRIAGVRHHRYALRAFRLGCEAGDCAVGDAGEPLDAANRKAVAAKRTNRLVSFALREGGDGAGRVGQAENLGPDLAHGWVMWVAGWVVSWGFVFLGVGFSTLICGVWWLLLVV